MATAPLNPPLKLQFRPGINRESTDYGNTGGWYDCNLIRFKTGTPESMGGWQKFTSEAALGTWRSLFPWSLLDGSLFYAGGTNVKYYLIRGNSLVDITPIRQTTNPMANNPFATSIGTTTVTVTDVANGAVVGDYVTFSLATGPFGGVPAADINIEHVITSIVDVDHYTITVATTASSSASGGGAVAIAEYQLSVGLDTSATGNGWGTGPWGSGGWGTHSDTSVVTDQLRLWSEDNFGEDLLFNVRNGGIYFKDMSVNPAIRGVNLADLYPTGNVPIIARQILVSDNDRHVLAFAANTIGTTVQDRSLIRWSDTEDAGDWTPDTTNSAGSLRINIGSEILRAVETTTETLVFTDVSLHSFRFIGPPFTFGATRIATNIHLIGPNAVASTGAETFWMANGLFQFYDGVVHDIPCGIRSYIFSILNSAQTEKIYAGINRTFKEVIWLMPVNGSDENNFYAICNYEDPSNILWYYGSFNDVGRTTWIDAWFENVPLAASTDGFIYAHETGATDQSGVSAAMLDATLTSSVFEIGNGENFMIVSRLISDFDFTGSTDSTPEVTVSFQKRDYPGSPFVAGPDNVVDAVLGSPSTYTAFNDNRFRARSTNFKIATSSIGTLWQYGVARIYLAPDGQQ